MKTKLLLTTLAFSLSIVAFGQEKTTLEKRITNYSVKIDSIVSSEKEKMNIELNEVEKKFKDGKISESMMLKERNRISNNYSETINTKIDAEKDSLDEITKASAMNSVLGIENDSVSKSKEKNPKKLLNTGGLYFSLGFLNLTKKTNFLNFENNSDDINFGKSISLTYGVKLERQIGKSISPVLINFGLGLRADSFYLNNGNVFSQNNNQLVTSPFTFGDLKYSRLNVTYLEIPLDFNLVLNPKYVEYEGEKYLDATKSQFRVGVGIYGDLKIANGIKYRYSDNVSSSNIFEQKVENGLNPFVFGTRLSVGYAGFNLFLKKDLTPTLNNDANLNNKYAWQIGLELASFNF